MVALRRWPVADRYDSQTALLVVDLQNDFADPRGSLYVRGGDTLLSAINAEVAAAGAGGALVAYTQDWHPPSTPHFQSGGGVWPAHCVRDTWGAAFVAGLDVSGPVVRKGVGGEDGYSGFSVRDPESGAGRRTELEALLRGRSVRAVVIAGLATDYCVKETAIDAAHLGFRTTVPRQLVRAVELSRGDASRAFQAMRRAGAEVG
jgi:nicotinamidase/pyrazinamidase